MTIAKFYVSSEKLRRESLVFEGHEHHYLSRVLRMRRGQEIIVLNGEGLVGRASISELTPHRTAIIVEQLTEVKEERPRLHIYQALTQRKKMDHAVQGLVELGAYSLTFFVCQRSSPSRLPEEDRMERWRKIAVESSRLAGRPFLPHMRKPVEWGGVLEDLRPMNMVLFADEDGGRRPTDALGDAAAVEIALLVGPEGGFTDEERKDLTALGATPVTLGKTILRAETAGLVLVAAVRCHFGLL